MLDDKKLVKVTNRSRGSVSYRIPDLNNLNRIFENQESKMLPMEELRKLSYQRGGLILLKDCFIIDDEEAVQELLGDVEPEYYYAEREVKNLLENGDLDQLEDCLNFAPESVLNMVKDIAVRIEINDVRKRKMILDKLDFNVTRAIEINHETQEEEVKEEKKVRKSKVPVESTEESNKPKRKATAPNYKVVN